MAEKTFDNANRNPDSDKAPFTIEELGQGKGGGVAVDIKGAEVEINVEPNPLDEYAPSNYDIDTDVRYYGFINEDGAYYILRDVTVSGDYKYFVGSGDYDTSWTNRTSLIYQRFDVVF